MTPKERHVTGIVDFRVRYAETDQMGRAHHRHYLVWCELGRTALMRENGVPYDELEKSGIMLPVARAEVEYRAPLSYDEEVRLYTEIQRVRSREVVFSYRFARPEDDTTVALARIALVSTDTTGRPTRLPGEVRAVLQDLAAGPSNS